MNIVSRLHCVFIFLYLFQNFPYSSEMFFLSHFIFHFFLFLNFPVIFLDIYNLRLHSNSVFFSLDISIPSVYCFYIMQHLILNLIIIIHIFSSSHQMSSGNRSRSNDNKSQKNLQHLCQYTHKPSSIISIPQFLWHCSRYGWYYGHVHNFHISHISQPSVR